MAEPFARLLDALEPAQSLYLPGATGEVTALAEALRSAPERAAGIRFVGCYVPGMNEIDYAGLHPDARATTFMLPRAMRASFEAGRVDLVPATYAAAAQMMAGMRVDVAVAHVAAPDGEGLCSLGIASDFTPLIWPQAKKRVLVVNAAMPTMRRGPRLAVADADLVINHDGPLIQAPTPKVGADVDAVAARVAALVPDGATLQAGIGGAPGAVWDLLRDRRGLVVRSGMANGPLRTLFEAGALASGGHRAGIAYGSTDFYDYLAHSDLVEFATTRETHDAAALARLPRFHAINSALEVDLFGQVNVEWQGGRIGSGVGGAANFARAAMASHGGRSIVALPSTARKGTVSRIVVSLTAPAVGLPRTEVDTVVTEHGVADLRHAGLDQRAERLIDVSDPSCRGDLARGWAELRRTF